MKRNQSLFWVCLFVFIVSSCTEDALDLYDQEESGSTIYFKEAYENNSNYYPLSFGYSGSDVTDSIIRIPVATTGNLQDYDRAFALRIDSSTMVEGVHYEILSQSIRANRAVDTLAIKLYRTEDIAQTGVDIYFSLVENEHFQIRIPYKYISSTNLFPLQEYHLYLDDIADVPYLWTTYVSRSFIIAYWGSYSKKKVELMLSVLGVSSGYFYDPTMPPSSQQVYNWSNYMKYWLALEESEGRIYYDENGNKISMST